MVSDSKIWKGNWTFILAAAGSAVGLGNIWKFPTWRVKMEEEHL